MKELLKFKLPKVPLDIFYVWADGTRISPEETPEEEKQREKQRNSLEYKLKISWNNFIDCVDLSIFLIMLGLIISTIIGVISLCNM